MSPCDSGPSFPPERRRTTSASFPELKIMTCEFVRPFFFFFLNFYFVFNCGEIDIKFTIFFFRVQFSGIKCVHIIAPTSPPSVSRILPCNTDSLSSLNNSGAFSETARRCSPELPLHARHSVGRETRAQRREAIQLWAIRKLLPAKKLEILASELSGRCFHTGLHGFPLNSPNLLHVLCVLGVDQQY